MSAQTYKATPENKFLKILSGRFSQTSIGVSGDQVIINHGLGYPPAYKAFFTTTANSNLLPEGGRFYAAGVFDEVNTATGSCFLDVEITPTQIIFSPVNAATGITRTIVVEYVLYADRTNA